MFSPAIIMSWIWIQQAAMFELRQIILLASQQGRAKTREVRVLAQCWGRAGRCCLSMLWVHPSVRSPILWVLRPIAEEKDSFTTWRCHPKAPRELLVVSSWTYYFSSSLVEKHFMIRSQIFPINLDQTFYLFILNKKGIFWKVPFFWFAMTQMFILKLNFH